MTINQKKVYSEVHKSLENRDYIRQSLWNTFMICNSLFISSFAIIVAINLENNKIAGFITPFLIFSLIPISLCLINHIFSYFAINKRVWLRLAYLKSQYPEDFPNQEEPEEKRKFFKRLNCLFMITDVISIICTFFVLSYILLILLELK